MIDEPKSEGPVEEVQAEETESARGRSVGVRTRRHRTAIDTVEPPSDVVPEPPAMEAGVEESMDTEAAGSDETVEAAGRADRKRRQCRG